MPETKTISKQNVKVQRSEEREFHMIAQYAPFIIARFDREARCLYVNEAFERIFGTAAAQVIGKTAREAGMDPESASIIERTVGNVFASAKERISELHIAGQYYQTAVRCRRAPGVGCRLRG